MAMRVARRLLLAVAIFASARGCAGGSMLRGSSLVDHVLGTYVPESEWGPKAKTSNLPESRPQYDATEYARALAAASTVKVPVGAN